jgi:hypothetical protein
MEDWLTPNGESRRFIGHQPLTLSGTDLESCQQKSPQIEEVKHAPEPQRLVLPLLQNLHSRHSAV